MTPDDIAHWQGWCAKPEWREEVLDGCCYRIPHHTHDRAKPIVPSAYEHLDAYQKDKQRHILGSRNFPLQSNDRLYLERVRRLGDEKTNGNTKNMQRYCVLEWS
jgi:hypothetical protein